MEDWIPRIGASDVEKVGFLQSRENVGVVKWRLLCRRLKLKNYFSITKVCEIKRKIFDTWLQLLIGSL